MAINELIPFVVTMRGVIHCHDEVEARMAADVMTTEASKYLDEEDGDEVFITQVTPFAPVVEHAELIDRLKRARNDLVKTRIVDCWNTARDLDRIIFGLQRGVNPHEIGTYNYGHFMEVSSAILERGEYPL